MMKQVKQASRQSTLFELRPAGSVRSDAEVSQEVSLCFTQRLIWENTELVIPSGL